jgi:hypothetical protein
MKLALLAALLAAGAATGACCGNPSLHEVRAPAPDPSAMGFDRDTAGSLPAGWSAGATHGAAELATWAVHADQGAVSPANVLSLTRTNHAGAGTFNLCWRKDARFRDGELRVAMRADAGESDQGGGLMWRARDADNYYVCRFNPLESNFRVYRVKDGERVQLATATVGGKAGEWHQLEVEQAGMHITCSLDGKKLLEADDATFPDAGGVGLWTKSDARTSFDDLSIRAR